MNTAEMHRILNVLKPQKHQHSKQKIHVPETWNIQVVKHVPNFIQLHIGHLQFLGIYFGRILALAALAHLHHPDGFR